jgi:hypothetical protein
MTRSANTQLSSKIEENVKTWVNTNRYYVYYHVEINVVKSNWPKAQNSKGSVTAHIKAEAAILTTDSDTRLKPITATLLSKRTETGTDTILTAEGQEEAKQGLTNDELSIVKRGMGPEELTIPLPIGESEKNQLLLEAGKAVNEAEAARHSIEDVITTVTPVIGATQLGEIRGKQTESKALITSIRQSHQDATTRSQNQPMSDDAINDNVAEIAVNKAKLLALAKEVADLTVSALENSEWANEVADLRAKCLQDKEEASAMLTRGKVLAENIWTRLSPLQGDLNKLLKNTNKKLLTFINHFSTYNGKLQRLFPVDGQGDDLTARFSGLKGIASRNPLDLKKLSDAIKDIANHLPKDKSKLEKVEREISTIKLSAMNKLADLCKETLTPIRVALVGKKDARPNQDPQDQDAADILSILSAIIDLLDQLCTIGAPQETPESPSETEGNGS